jgi:hypothetical protein
MSRKLGPLFVALLLAGCAGDTGIIVAVTGSTVDELEFNVAVERGNLFEIEPGISGQRYGVNGRNLTADPYEHLLQEEDGSGPPLTVRVLVVGRKGGKDTHFAVTDPPQAFIREEVVRRVVTLAGLGKGASSLTRPSTGCLRVWWKSGDKSYTRVLGVEDDRDCDGHRPPADCKDSDAAVYPGAKELCDGKENNCDGKFFAPSQACYGKDGSGICRKGTRYCGDAKGSGWAKGCTVSASSPKEPDSHCEAYAGCASAPDPFACTEKQLGPAATLVCTIEQDATTSTLCGGGYRLKPPSTTSTSNCTWTIVDDGGFGIGLTDGQSAPTSSINICEPALAIKDGSPPGSGKVVLELKYGEDTMTINVEITVQTAASCGTAPFSCTLKN